MEDLANKNNRNKNFITTYDQLPALYDSCDFRIGTQNNAHEFLVICLDRLKRETNILAYNSFSDLFTFTSVEKNTYNDNSCSIQKKVNDILMISLEGSSDLIYLLNKISSKVIISIEQEQMHEYWKKKENYVILREKFLQKLPNHLNIQLKLFSNIQAKLVKKTLQDRNSFFINLLE